MYWQDLAHVHIFLRSNICETFTNIGVLKIMNMYQIMSIYLITNKHYGQKETVCAQINLVYEMENVNKNT